MNGVFELPSVVFLLLAVLVIARLVSVLGRKTGNERPVAVPRSSDPAGPLPRVGDTGEGTAGTISGGKLAEERIKGAAPEGSPLEAGLLAIARKDSMFDPKAFLNGARTAYEMIVMAFAQGDRRQLKTLTANEVFDGFLRAITEREARGETNETKFIGIHRVDIVDAEVKGSDARVTVKFLSQMITVVRNKAGSVVEGDAGQVRDVTDVWTFSRDTTTRDPNWKLVGTQPAE